MKKKSAILAASCILLFSLAFGLSAAIELEKIMKSDDLVGTEPRQVRWSPDSRFIYFSWKNPVDKAQGTYAYDTRKGQLSLLKPEEARLLPPLQGTWNEARNRALVAEGRSLRLYEHGAWSKEPLIEFGERIRAAAWAKKEEKIFFLGENGIYSFGLASPHLKELVHFAAEAEKSAQPETGPAQKYLAQEEKKLIKNFPSSPFSFRRGMDMPFAAKNTLNLKKDERPAGFEVSGDEKWLLVSIFAAAESEGTATIIPRYIAQSGYTENENSRTKAGDSSSFRQRLVLFSLADGRQVEMKTGKKNSRIASAFFSPAGKVVGICLGDDSHDAWILQFDAKGEMEKEIFHLHDDAWIESSISGYRGQRQTVGERMLAIVESAGFRRLVVIDLAGRTRILTPGEYEVEEFRLSDDGKSVVWTSSEGHPGIRNSFHLDLASGKKRALTRGQAFSEAFPSPDLRKLAVIRSDSVTPPELFYVKDGREIRVTRSPAPDFWQIPLQKPEIVSFKASDGVPVFARLLRPQKKNGAAVLFIHGAGYLQNAHFGWSTYWREFLFGNLLAEKGYTFMDVDYRGSSGYGRDFRTGIFGHMGGRDLDDLVDAARYLAEKEGIDPKRIGLFGGSYGGFLTLMGLFKYPDTFACGAALRPVTDWAHYSSYYTNPILGGKPQDVPENYRRSSPIYFAENLKKPLLILHGMADDNVHFQDSVRLAERLIELKKTGWWLSGYPSERHSFRYEESWLDEYRRILELFVTYLAPHE